ncbi:MAG: DUF3574 domain-containing protein [Methylosarcina sp.]
MFKYHGKTTHCLFRRKPAKRLRKHETNRFVIHSLLALALMLEACSPVSIVTCSQGERVAVQDMLYFGTASPIGVISRDKWSEFLRVTVTSRFPKGFSVWQAKGQWQSEEGEILRESSYILSLVHPDNDSSEKAVQEIIDQYKSQFRQDAVLRVRFPACMSL